MRDFYILYHLQGYITLYEMAYDHEWFAGKELEPVVVYFMVLSWNSNRGKKK
jgi:hypothetical protein